jgi:uncharacterized protein YcbK (DUF882 family)
MSDGGDALVGSRRGLIRGLGGLLGLGVIGLLPGEVEAAREERQLRLHSRALQEEVRIVYFADGRYVAEGLDAAKRIFRDRRNDAMIEVDPRLLDVLWAVQRRLAPGASLEVVCGYRSPETNAQLRHEMRGVASNSYHMYGQAIDLRIPSCPLRTLHRTAMSLEAGGVGYYPSSNFVHLDTGPPRTWGQGRTTTRKAPSSTRRAPSRTVTRTAARAASRT